jgi:taurine--2-oxoglutarate transaminase
MPGVVHFFGPYLYRSHFQAASASEECAAALHHLHETVIYEGPDRIAGILMETVVGTNGILVPPEGYLQGVREICDRYGILLMLDEVMCGFGRCGRWFATERWSVEPDVIAFAKGVNSGYVPLGGVLLSRAVADTFQRVRPYPGGMTYSGHPLACATAVESIQIFKDENILGHVQELESEVYGPKLRDLAERHPAVGDVRGVGAFWAIELVRDHETREPLLDGDGTEGPLRRFNARCRENGVWPFTYANRIHLVPPLNISREELCMGLEVIDEALAECDGFVA